MAKVFTITEGLENMGALKTGGQGSVYKARRMGEIITAVKLLPTPIHSESDQDKNFASFQNEVRKLKKVNEVPNPNVVKILSSGITDSGSFPFIEMEYIEGPDMEELLRPPHDPVFTINEAVKVAEQLSHALAHCHRMDVKHGDMKSNNVKFNNATGNYMLIDFGLSAMSDEQRRTSLRHAGAIEFMAPEQGAGQLFFETDVYGFGVILFELLAGMVPFPLNDGSESARNAVMLAHLETPPPDLKGLRHKAMPSSWTEDKRRKEAVVPEWLLSTIYRCLRKKPEERFANGIELYQFIAANRVGNNLRTDTDTSTNSGWQYQAEKLLKEKTLLQQKLSQAEQELQQLRSRGVSADLRVPGQDDYQKNPRKNTTWMVAFLITLLVASGLGYALVNSKEKKPDAKPVVSKPKPPTSIGEYKVLAARSYFYNEPNNATRRNAFVLRGAAITAFEERGGFIYTEFTNARGQKSKGWLQRNELVTPEQWSQQQDNNNTVPSAADIEENLKEAEAYLAGNQFADAARIYNFLSGFDVPEAMYGAANMALQGRNAAFDCEAANRLLEKAAAVNYLPAKRTLGLLHLFAENPAVLSINGYTACTFQKNFDRAKILLTEAANGGDTLARQLLNKLQLDETNNTPG